MFNKKDQRSRKRGQSTVEYIVLVTAVLGVAILFLTNKNSGMQQKLNQTMDTATNGMVDMAEKLAH